jgi:hypothetical protein
MTRSISAKLRTLIFGSRNTMTAVLLALRPKRRPVELVYTEPHPTRASALTRERQLKGWTRAKKEALIKGNLDLLKRL